VIIKSDKTKMIMPSIMPMPMGLPQIFWTGMVTQLTLFIIRNRSKFPVSLLNCFHPYLKYITTLSCEMHKCKNCHKLCKNDPDKI